MRQFFWFYFITACLGLEISSKVDLKEPTKLRATIDSRGARPTTKKTFYTFPQDKLNNDLAIIKIIVNKKDVYNIAEGKCTNCICDILSRAKEGNFDSTYPTVIEIIAINSEEKFKVDDIPIITGTRGFQNNERNYNSYPVNVHQPEMTWYFSPRNDHFDGRKIKPFFVDDKIEPPLSQT